MSSTKYAILIDGGFFTKIFRPANGDRYPSANDVESVMQAICSLPELINKELLRIYYYDAPPLQVKVKNPLDKHEIDLSKTELAKKARKLHSELVMKPDFALRMGELKTHAWTVKPSVFKRTSKTINNASANCEIKELEMSSVVIYPQDLYPEIEQKGVDLKIGMDIACMAIRQTVDTIVMITGDSDLVPALKLARREGVRVYCVQFKERKLTDVLMIHADRVLELSIELLSDSK